MKPIRLYRIGFEVNVQDLPKPQHQSVLAVGTDDINSVVDYVRNQVCQSECEVEVSVPGQDRPVSLKRPVTGFQLLSVEPQIDQINFIDIRALVEAEIISFHENH